MDWDATQGLSGCCPDGSSCARRADCCRLTTLADFGRIALGMGGESSALCQAEQHPAVTEKGPYVTYHPAESRRMGSIAVSTVLARQPPGCDGLPAVHAGAGRG